MIHSTHERVIALAGLFQATQLVQQVARKGMVDQQDFETCIKSILITDVENTEEIYGDIAGIRTGLQALIDSLTDKSSQDIETTRYIVGLLHLERKLSKHPKLMGRIGKGIKLAQSQSNHFHITHENIIANLAGTYSESISTIPPKIIVQGEQGYLNNPDNANKVRALLLAGMRAAILWRQCGGTRWQLLLQRKKLLSAAQELMGAITH